MAQIELRFFTPTERSKKLEIARLSMATVAMVHYGIEIISPGDITIAVPLLDTELSDSDANYELEISEGSDNQPKDPLTGELLVHDLAQEVLNERAIRISTALRKVFRRDSHNIFEVTGITTGWVQYKPDKVQSFDTTES